jgi:hypothetical protein
VPPLKNDYSLDLQVVFLLQVSRGINELSEWQVSSINYLAGFHVQLSNAGLQNTFRTILEAISKIVVLRFQHGTTRRTNR